MSRVKNTGRMELWLSLEFKTQEKKKFLKSWKVKWVIRKKKS